MKATKTIHVDAKPEQVLSFLLDSTATPRGMTMEFVHESPDVVGSSYEWTFKMLGIPRKGVTVFTDYVPGERMEFRNFGAMEGTATVTVEPDSGGSKVTHEMDSRIAVPLISRFLDPVMQKVWEKNIEWAKHEIEKQEKVGKTTS
ncbi:MAG: SRPBCC family protein [Acidimicrobiia bacterium]|nr:SRPBCC family protein [Acidimicrobiia bacterium]NNF88732.1 SRPBCC family protein [Acidimicrobiia bacterium]NNL13801.1 SRPBCC family protein [Acidimicrobiia bacterium]